MRKVFFFLIFFIPSFLFATTYRSNRMAQNLGELTTDSDFVLEESGNKMELLFKGKVIKNLTTSEVNGIKTVTENDFDNEFTVIKKYQNGLLVEKKTSCEDYDETVVFQYHDGSLVFCTTTRENFSEETTETDNPSETEYFIRSVNNGKLIGTKKFSTVNFTGTKYLIEDDKLYRQYNSNLIYEDELSFNEDGTFTLEHAGTEYTFSKRGDLILSENNVEKNQFFYDDDYNLVKQITEKDANRTESFFEDNKLMKIDYYENDIFIYSSRFDNSEFGSIKTIMQNNKPIADVYYDFDNVKILQIEYLN